jgi:hypothetical protein
LVLEDGTLRFRPHEMTALFLRHPQLDRQESGAKFQKSHSLSVGRTKLSGLFIDGLSLTHTHSQPPAAFMCYMIVTFSKPYARRSSCM